MMGGLDWGAAAVIMWAAQLACVGAVGVFSSRGPLTLTRLWTSFIALFAVQVITNICYAYELLA